MKKLVLLLALSFAFGGVALAKPAFVSTGMTCKSCHDGAPKKGGKMTAKAECMKEKVGANCAECHTKGEAAKGAEKAAACK